MPATANGSRHPLEPLSADEITRTAEILRESGQLSDDFRVCQMYLQEPPKETVRGYPENGAVPREARVLVYARGAAGGRDLVVSITSGKVISSKTVDQGQVSLSFLDLAKVIGMVKADPDWQKAMRRRGIENFDLVQIDPWVTGGFEPDAPAGHRLMRALSYRRTHSEDNGYARPIEGVIGYVDLTDERVLRIDDHGVVPEPPEHGNYDPEHVGPLRDDIKPLEISQREGPSFTVDGHQIEWQRWRFRISLHPVQGLVLHTVAYRDGERWRPILYRASLAEMVVPYGDPSPMHHWKSVFDAGELAIGHLTNSLKLGCDCLGEIRYFDATYCAWDGTPQTIAQAVCLHEEDFGVLWKHTDFHSGSTEVRRSRRLVVSAIHTVGNYEYGFFWYFYQDGNIQLEVKLTGIVQTSAILEGDQPECATVIAPQLAAPNHQHLFCVRLDFEVDGQANSVHEVDVEPLPRERNPAGNAFAARPRLIARESEAARDSDPARHRYWTIENPQVHNRLGQPVAYRVVPGNAPRMLAREDAAVAKRASFAQHNLWVTAYDPAELHAAGDYPNQHPGGAGLPAYVAADRPLENSDVVVWYSFGVTHIPRPEDWPVMPTEYTSFMLQPIGFFDRNPAIDVPAQHCIND